MSLQYAGSIECDKRIRPILGRLLQYQELLE